jgi:hypothetical protein
MLCKQKNAGIPIKNRDKEHITSGTNSWTPCRKRLREKYIVNGVWYVSIFAPVNGKCRVLKNRFKNNLCFTFGPNTNYLFDKKKGKLFFTVFFLAREQKNRGKKFFLFIEHEVLFYETRFLHPARTN